MKKKKDEIKKLQQDTKQDASDELETVEEGELISSKKVIYIEIDDEIGHVYDKIKSIKNKDVYLVVPQKAVLFQSVVNLKILKRKAAEQDKKVHLITNDKNGMYLAKQTGIEVYDKSTSENKIPLFSTELNDEKLRITPIRASVNAVEEDNPTRLAERKLSISEILRKNKITNKLHISRIDPNIKKKKERSLPKFVLVAPNRHALIGLTVLSLFILLTIIYIALPGATIYLTPTASVLEKSVNITLSDYQKNRTELETRPPHMVASFPISTTISKEITHTATGKKLSAENMNASGKIKIVNTTGNEWPLVAETRFQTQEGLVFRIKQGITVPAASGGVPGTVEATVVADSLDAYGAIIGERGNIGPSKFFLPALREDSRAKIYAESAANMTGGVTDYVSFISKEDLEAAQVRIKDELLKTAIEDLKKEVENKNTLTGEENKYKLLDGENAVKVGEVRFNIDQTLEGKEIKDFKVTGSVDVSGVYYDYTAMMDILVSELKLKKSPQKELLRVNEDSVSYRVFEWNTDSGKIKMTANIKGVEQYEIDPKLENGERLLTKIREHIVGKDIEEAKNYIQNLPEINKVEIDSWPAWSPTVPSISDNINFEIRNNIKPTAK